MRFIPAVPRFGKIVQGDAVLTAHKFTVSEEGKLENVLPFTIPVTKGDITMVDVTGIHNNRVYLLLS